MPFNFKRTEIPEVILVEPRVSLMTEDFSWSPIRNSILLLLA